jgi:hypothetical protein
VRRANALRASASADRRCGRRSGWLQRSAAQLRAICGTETLPTAEPQATLWRALRAEGFAGRSPISGPDVPQRAQSNCGALARAERCSMPVGVPRRPSTQCPPQSRVSNRQRRSALLRHNPSSALQLASDHKRGSQFPKPKRRSSPTALYPRRGAPLDDSRSEPLAQAGCAS